MYLNSLLLKRTLLFIGLNVAFYYAQSAYSAAPQVGHPVGGPHFQTTPAIKENAKQQVETLAAVVKTMESLDNHDLEELSDVVKEIVQDDDRITSELQAIDQSKAQATGKIQAAIAAMIKAIDSITALTKQKEKEAKAWKDYDKNTLKLWDKYYAIVKQHRKQKTKNEKVLSDLEALRQQTTDKNLKDLINEHIGHIQSTMLAHKARKQEIRRGEKTSWRKLDAFVKAHRIRSAEADKQLTSLSDLAEKVNNFEPEFKKAANEVTQAISIMTAKEEEADKVDGADAGK